MIASNPGSKKKHVEMCQFTRMEMISLNIFLPQNSQHGNDSTVIWNWLEFLTSAVPTLRKIYFHFLPWYDRSDSFRFDLEANGNPFGSENRKETCHHDHIPFNVKGNGNIIFSVWSALLFLPGEVTHREIFSKSYWIKPKSDCIYQFPINLEQSKRTLSVCCSKSIGAW